MIMSRCILTFLIWVLSVSLYAQKIHVVSIGIADYQYINDLRFTVNDVNLFNELMLNHGAEIKTLKNSHASHVNIISALRLISAKAKPEDIVVIYFSGHGYPGGFCCWDFAGSSGSLISQNADNQELVAQSNRSRGGLSYQEMQILLRNCRAKRKIVFADACFSGGLRVGEQLGLSVQPVKNGDIIYFLSSQLDETSLESRPDGPFKNGIYTHFLVQALYGKADTNRDALITLDETFNYVYPKVLEYSIDADRNSRNAGRGPVQHQHPTLWGKYDKNMILFNVLK